MERPHRPFDLFRVRRSCLAVPASSERFISKAHGLPADEVFLDLEDAVAPAAKAQARANAVAAVTGDWGGRVLAVRVNDASTPWAHRDVIDVVSAAGRLDAIVLPKVTSPGHVVWLDLLLGQVEREAGLPPGRTGIEAQIEDAGGLAAVNAIAAASACRPSTGLTSRSATSTASGGRRPAPRRSATTASGSCTRTRSTRPTRCSRPPRTISRARRGLSRRTRTPPAYRPAARSCSATR
jgi:citrate lyase beta subunit